MTTRDVTLLFAMLAVLAQVAAGAGAVVGIGARWSPRLAGVVLERFPALESGVCEVANPCTVVWVRRFGYLTIPAMALSAFALVAVLLLAAGADERAAAAEAQETRTQELEVV